MFDHDLTSCMIQLEYLQSSLIVSYSSGMISLKFKTTKLCGENIPYMLLDPLVFNTFFNHLKNRIIVCKKGKSHN